MKKTRIAAALACLVTFASLGTGECIARSAISRGTHETGVSLGLDLGEGSQGYGRVSGKYGVFAMYGLELGVQGSLRESGSALLALAGVRAERTIDIGRRTMPFLGLGLAYASLNSRNEDLADTTALVLQTEVGVKYYLKPTTALAVFGSAELANEDIFGKAHAPGNKAIGIHVGMRFVL